MRGSAKGIFLSKTHLPTTVTQCWIPPRKHLNWINVGNVDIPRNISYSYFSSNNLYEILHRGLPSLPYH